MEMHDNTKSTISKTSMKYILIILLQVAIIFMAIQFIFRYSIYKVSGTSMEPTLSARQTVLMEKRPTRVNRGDIVTHILNPGQPTKEISLKRVVAVGGDIVRYVDGNLLVNEVKIERHTNSQTDAYLSGLEVMLGPDEYWVLSDNMEADTVDSRQLGVIRGQQITGRLVRPKDI